MIIWQFLLVLGLFLRSSSAQGTAVPLCKTPKSPNLNCLRIGNKLNQVLYEVNKCGENTADHQERLFICTDKTKLSTDEHTYVCNGENWQGKHSKNSTLPSCKDSTIVKDHHGKVVPNDERVVEGTTIEISCHEGYAKPHIFDNSSRLECLKTGKWSGNFSNCENLKEDLSAAQFDIFGDQFGELQRPFLRSFNGQVTDIVLFPWHVGIYALFDKKTYFSQACGGSIISEQLVVSAAHCFWNRDETKMYPKEKYKVIAGKTYRSIDKDKDTSQERNITKIFLHKTFIGADTNYADDIAVIVVFPPFDFNRRVQKILFSSESKYWDPPGRSGKVVGWGQTETHTVSETLKYVTLDIVKCETHLPVYGKFCAFNNITSQTTCPGDSGGGFVVLSEKGPLLIGVVSTGLKDENDNGLCEPEPSTYNHVLLYNGLFAEAYKYLATYFSCPDNTIKCDSRCLPVHKICDGFQDCGYNKTVINDETFCTYRSNYATFHKGLEILKYFRKCEASYPNWVIPTGSIWMAIKYLSEVTNSTISNRLKKDFGIISNNEVIANIKATSIDGSRLRSPVRLGNNSWTAKIFENKEVVHTQQSGYFYVNSTRVSLIFDSDRTYTINGLKSMLNFTNKDGSSESIEAICVLESAKTHIANTTIHKIQIEKDLCLYIVESQNVDETLAALRAYSLLKLKRKFEKSGPLCFPKIEGQTTADYSPIFYKMGYNYAFSLDPIEMNIFNDPMRIQMLIRGFVELIVNDDVEFSSEQLKSSHNITKPFIFMIEEEQTSSVIFTGRITKPNDLSAHTDIHAINCKPFTL